MLRVSGRCKNPVEFGTAEGSATQRCSQFVKPIDETLPPSQTGKHYGNLIYTDNGKLQIGVFTKAVVMEELILKRMLKSALGRYFRHDWLAVVGRTSYVMSVSQSVSLSLRVSVGLFARAA